MTLHKDVTNRVAIKNFETLENRLNQAHNNKFSYDKVVYRDAKTKVIITCPIHGDFKQIVPSHLRGIGCKKCGTAASAASKRTSVKTFIDKASLLHHKKYTYVSVVYKNTDTKVIITCNIHGNFEQAPHNHLNGAGCPNCANKATGVRTSGNTKTFIDKASKIHNYVYSYAKTEYINNRSDVIITCSEHGDFKQGPGSHLNGRGCPKCNKLFITTKDFIKKATEVHSDEYAYSKSEYTNTKGKVIITCKKHGDFYQTAHGHLQGNGCPECNPGSFKTNRPGLLYYFKVTDGINIAWKIGVTNHSLKTRYTADERSRMSEIQEKWYENGQECYDEEQRILKKYKEHKYEGPKLLISGNTELFNIDIFKKEKHDSKSGVCEQYKDTKGST